MVSAYWEAKAAAASACVLSTCSPSRSAGVFAMIAARAWPAYQSQTVMPG